MQILNENDRLHYAIRFGKLDTVKYLINAGVDVNRFDDMDKTPIYYADNLEIINVLIDAGADIHLTIKNKGTLLSYAVYQYSLEVIKGLIDAGADVNKADFDGKNPLYWAVLRRDLEIVKVLIKAGADVNKADHYGTTPLHLTINLDIAQELILAGADINKVNKFGITPFDCANFDIAQLLKERMLEQMWQIISQKPLKLPPEIIWTHILPLILEN